MNGYYSIHASITRTAGGWTSTRHLPTFYLHNVVQGLLSDDDAELAAIRMIREVISFAAGSETIVNAHAVYMGDTP